ncbi:Quinoprotein alcohol dehydrogenase-like protein [Dioscorea alata]|uniref:Quinoprotein alcohol dehydrogenase-like protein n=2 Tax=Dioscorea alata TaxID=55571 RepID=A0ACB7W189_DIOAL|nr:Quinoprotein alcohol dehydrogenase-like protein [Dioscorea alata]
MDASSRRSWDRTVLEPFVEIDLAEIAGLSSATPLSIRSVSLFSDSHQTLVLIGTGGGKLLLLSLDPSSKSIELLRSVSISNRPIESIEILTEIDRILVLSDGFLFLVDRLLLQVARKLGFIKDVTAVVKRLGFGDSLNLDFSGDGLLKADVSSAGQRLLQKLGSGIRANGLKQLRVSESHRDKESNCLIAVAALKRLVLVELTVSATIDVDFDYGGISVRLKEMQGVEGVKTMAWIGDSVIVGSLDGYMLFSASSGKCTPIFSLPESSGPPKLLPLLRSKEVLLLVDNVGVIVNDVGQPVGGSLVFQYVPDSIVEMSSHVIVARDSKMELYRRKTGTSIQSLNFTKSGSGPCVVVSDEQRSGETVVVATSHKAIFLHKVSAEEQIKDLLRKNNFKEAISLLEEVESEGEITEEMLSFIHAQLGFLLLFDLHFEEAVNHFLLSKTMQPSEVFPFIMRDPNRWSHLVPRNRYWGLHPPPIPLEDVVDDGLMAIQRGVFLRKAGVDTSADEDFLSNLPSKAELLESGIKNIIRYLCVSRNKDLIPSVREGVDTLLMYLYRALNHVDDMEQLASSENSCVVEELESLLGDSGHLRTLAFLYASKGISSKALSIWHILARNYSTGLWKDTSISVEHDLPDVSIDSISGQKAAAIEASKLLEESADEDLVLEHLGWIAEIDQDLAVLILTSDKRVNQLPPEEVLKAIDPKKVEIQQRYLQWLIEDQDSEDIRFHTLYALSLAKSAIEAIEGTSGNVDSKADHEKKVSDVDSGPGNSIREKLQVFLQVSDLYDPEEVLDLIGRSELWLEKAILCKKMGQETLVLEILALKLEDCEAAEQYCAEIGRDDAYMRLLDLYLDPEDGKAPMFDAAVRLLHNHGESLDPLQVLEKLSPEMPLQLASNTILRMLRARVHHHHQGQIVHNISKAMNLDAQLARIEERSRYVQISDESICDSCHARLGTKLFAMYPDDSIVCYKCYRRLGESVSARGHDFQQDPVFKQGWLVTR